MNESGVKQQIVDNLQNIDTILVTVSTNPSVDELAAALGLTMYLNDLGKHATAVVSGELPPAINFLEPEKTFEPTIDSLRDFVIALDKEKADHLRYKVEGDVVKIFITPYKTVITSDDLDYSQGDYNVEMVIALGVTDQDHLDKALEAHGKIFHDATVVTIGTEPSTLGTIDWVEESASSLSELVTTLTESLQDADKPMTPQVASALLTGIVSATERFSNDKTTSQTMSISAVLMAAGANQQLIASKLREGAKLPLKPNEGKKLAPKKAADKKADAAEPAKRRGGGLSIAHKSNDSADASKEAKSAQPAASATKSAVTKPAGDKTAEDLLSEQLAAVAPVAPAAPTLKDIEEGATPDVGGAKSALDIAGAPNEPSLGGTLNATAQQAAEDKRSADANRNKTILSHGSGRYVGDTQPTFESPLNGAGKTDEEPSVDPFAKATTASARTIEPLTPATPTGTLADIDQQNRASVDDAPAGDAARDAVAAAVDAAPAPGPVDPMAIIEQAAATAPAPAPDPLGAPMTPPPPPMPDFSQLPPLPPPPPMPDMAAATAPAPALPPVAPPLFGPQPPEMPQAPLPPEQLGSVLPEAPAQPAAPVGPADPKQFKIPGQP